MKKFILSLPTDENKNIIIEDIKELCTYCKSIISTFYIHPPFGALYSDRIEIDTEETDEHINKLKEAIKIIKTYNIQISVAFNSRKLRTSECYSIIYNDILKFEKLFNVSIDNIICYDLFIKQLKQDFPNKSFTRSFNNLDTSINNDLLQYYDVIVLGGAHLRDIKYIQSLKEKWPNLKIELLLNNGCIPCIKECSTCSENFKLYLNKYSIEDYIANFVLFPKEFKLIEGYIDLYKLPCSRQYFDMTKYNLYNYIYQLNVNNINDIKKLTRLGAFWQYYESNLPFINLNTVYEIKNRYWSNLLAKNIDIRNL